MRILHAIHDFLPGHRAGSEIYALSLCRELEAAGVAVHVLCAEFDPSRPDGSLTWRVVDGIGVTEVVNNWTFSTFAETYEAPGLEPSLRLVLDAVGPDVLHVHSLLNLSFALPRFARERGAAVVGTIHDYTMVCPSGGQRVHRAEEWICRSIEPDRCSRCFPQHHIYSQWAFGRAALGGGRARAIGPLAGAARRLAPRWTARAGRALSILPGPPITAPDIERRLERSREVLAEFDRIVAPSPSLAGDMARLGAPQERLEVSDYGFPAIAVAPGEGGAGRLRLGFVGTLVWHKGVHVLLDALAKLPAESWTLDVWGDTALFAEYGAQLRRQAVGMPVRFRGVFDKTGAAAAYAAMDALVVPSLWLENSPLVIHEAFQCGVPVVGARLGGIADLVQDERNGLLYEAFSPEALAAALARLIDDPPLRRRLAEAATPVKSIAEDAREWIARYQAVAGREA